jgi:probable HAF family extracellular repeat protein
VDVVNSGPTPSLANAIALQGGAPPVGLNGPTTGEQLSQAEDIGDINGDGLPDFLFQGQNNSYILLGPVDLTSTTDIAALADIIVPTTLFENGVDHALGVPAQHMGDIDGDGVNDLMFVRHDFVNQVWFVTIIESGKGKGGALPHVLTQDSIISDPQNPNFGYVNEHPVITIRLSDASLGYSAAQDRSPPALDVAALHWTGDATADVLVSSEVVDSTVGAGSAAVGYLFDGNTLAVLGPGESIVPNHAHLAIYPDVTTSVTAEALLSGLGAVPQYPTLHFYKMIVPGDLNSDGRDDIVFLNSDYVETFGQQPGQPPFTEVGRAYVLLAGHSNAATLTLSQAHSIYEGVGIDGLATLGDLNGDGYADFAITRSTEDSGLQHGSVLGFYGAPRLAPGIVRADTTASFIIQRTSTTLPGGVALEGPIDVTAGDFNGDGQMDLAIGTPSSEESNTTTGVTFDQESHGSVYLFWDVAGKLTPQNKTLSLDDADVTLQGVGNSDGLGTLPSTPGYALNGPGPKSTQGLDLNGDGIDDLLVSAATADSTAGGFTRVGGKLYALYGTRVHNPVPTPGTPAVLHNSLGGAALVATSTGQPYTVAGTLAAGTTDQWYQFTTLGDGQAGNQIALGPNAQLPTTTTMPALDGTFLSNGAQNTQTDEVGPVSGGLGNSVVTGVNNAGVAVGNTFVVEFDGRFIDGESAFAWQQGVATLLPSLGVPNGTTAVAINQANQIIGQATDVHGNNHAVLWTPSPTQPDTWNIKDLGSGLFVTALNDSGQVVGYGTLPGGVSGAFLWQGDVLTPLLNPDHGNLTRATGINDLGQVVGYTGVLNHQTFTIVTHAFWWQAGSSIDLGALTPLGNSYATAINNQGAVAGYSDVFSPTGGPAEHAFVWQDSNGNGISDPGEMQDLGALQVGINSFAYAIADTGQAVGNAATTQGTIHAFETEAIGNTYLGIEDLSGLFGFATPFNANATTTASAESPSGNVIGGSATTFQGAADGYIATPSLVVGGPSGSEAVFEFDLTDLLSHINDPGGPFSAIQQVSLNLDTISSTLSAGDLVQVVELANTGTGNLANDVAGNSGNVIATSQVPSGQTGLGLINLDVTSEALQALSANKTRLMLAVRTTSQAGVLQIFPTDAGNGHQTGLVVTTSAVAGVRADLYDGQGGLLAKDVSAADLRNELAGTYYLHVYNPTGLDTAPVAFTLTINAPQAGYSQAFPVRAELFGGNGNNTLVASTAPYSIDRLYGGSGVNDFIGESVEVKNATANDQVVPPSEHIFNETPLYATDGYPDHVETFANQSVAVAVAEALGIPIAQAFRASIGKPARPILASEMAQLSTLNLQGIQLFIFGPAGLQDATNLQTLDLSNTGVSDLAPLANMTGLQFLNLTNAESTDLSQLAPLTGLKELAFDRTPNAFTLNEPLQNIATLQNLKQLEYVSLAYGGVSDVSPFANLANLKVLALPGNDVQDLQALAGTYIIDSTGAQGVTAGWVGDQGPASGGATALPSGAVSWWPGNGNANDTIGSNNGTLTGDATIAPGFVGQAFSFDGTTGYVQSSATNLPTGNQDRTMEMWVKMNGFVGSEAFFAGYGNFGVADETYHLGAGLGGGLFFSQWGNSIGGPILQQGVWYHIAVTNVGDAVTLYLNGQVVATGTLAINTPAGSNFYMGSFAGQAGESRKLDGLVDEVTVYNRALSPAEILAIYKAGAAGKAASSAGAAPVRIASSSLNPTARATWTFQNLPGGTYDVYATWPGDPSRSRQVDYQVTGDAPLGDVVVSQEADPVGLKLRGRSWQRLLEQVTVNNGTVTVDMMNDGTGTMAADSIMLVAVPPELPILLTLDLRNNPLNNVAQTALIPALAAEYPANPSIPLANGVLYTTDPGPTIQPIGPQSMKSGTAMNLTLAASDLDGDAITYTAQSSDPSITLRLLGDILVITAPPSLIGTARITVTAQDYSTIAPNTSNGRSAQTSFDLSVGSGALSGTVFVDSNMSGVLDVGETGLEGHVVYLDLNHDGELDPSDPATISGPHGNFSFSGLAAGQYIVRELDEPGWIQTIAGSPNGFLTANVSVGNTASGLNLGDVQVVSAGPTRRRPKEARSTSRQPCTIPICRAQVNLPIAGMSWRATARWSPAEQARASASWPTMRVPIRLPSPSRTKAVAMLPTRAPRW